MEFYTNSLVSTEFNSMKFCIQKRFFKYFLRNTFFFFFANKKKIVFLRRYLKNLFSMQRLPRSQNLFHEILYRYNIAIDFF